MLVFLKQHFLTLFLVFGFSVKLALYRNSKDIQLGYLWMTVFCTLVLIAQNMLRATFGSSPELSFWRTLAAMLGLAVRPVAALGIMMVVGWRSPIRISRTRYLRGSRQRPGHVYGLLHVLGDPL